MTLLGSGTMGLQGLWELYMVATAAGGLLVLGAAVAVAIAIHRSRRRALRDAA